MDNTYLENKLADARKILKNTIGLKNIYLEKDVFTILTKFGWVESLSLDEAPMYLNSLGYDFSSINTFTKGFITNEDAKIYAVRMDKHFNLFVISFNKYGEMDAYYSVTISNETLNICYILEEMTYKE